MSISNLQISILEILDDKKKYLTLNEITKDLNKYNVNLRTIQRELSSLIKNQRVTKEGKTANATYSIDEMTRYYKKYKFIYVCKDKEIAGLFFKLKDMYRFYYTNSFLINLSQPISTIPLSIEYFDFKEIPPIFEENIPEGINREIIEIGAHTSDDFDLLTLLDDNIGDLFFTKTQEMFTNNDYKKNPSYLSSLDEILGENNRINILKDFKIQIQDKQIFPEGHDLSKLEMKQTHGISGFQYKKLVNIDFENKEITSDTENSNIYIFKPYSKAKANPNNENYFPHISINEHLFMSFAKNELGFRVPYSAIIKRENDDEFHYIVKRFDRLGTNRYAKTTFAPYLGLISSTKYDTTSEKMFTRIAEELISPKERMKLLKHYAYSVIIQHEDMHTKNLSLIIESSKVFFSPLYDIACTGIYDTTKKLDSTLTINGKSKNIRPNDFKVLCKILNVDFKEFKIEVSLIASIYKGRLPIYINEIKTLGSIPFYKSKLKKKVGNDAQWVREKDSIEFSDVLFNFHKKRVEELISLNWI